VFFVVRKHYKLVNDYLWIHNDCRAASLPFRSHREVDKFGRLGGWGQYVKGCVYWLFLSGSCFPNEEKKGYKKSMLSLCFIRNKVKFERQFNTINGSFILALRNCNDFSWLFDYAYIINYLII
jgi:hypothetical protein